MHLIESGGYAAIAFLMTLESACIPIPSEVIQPFAGYLVFKGSMNLHVASMAGALGCALGSTLAYAVGITGGRPFVEKYGRFILLRKKDLDAADRFFGKYGEAAVFFSRLLPVIRTFISLPAGISRMNFPRFLAYSFVGSIPWCYLLTYVGMKLGENWGEIRQYFHGADYVMAAIILLGLVWFVWHHVKPEKA
jgi:membrane protein DedA with SNARE-associated domain